MSNPISHEEWNNWYSKVYGYFFRRVNNRQDVEDLTAETLNSFFLKENVQSPHGLMWTIARRKLINYINSKRSQPFNLVDSEDQMENNLDQYEQQACKHYQERIENLLQCVKNQLSGTDLSIVTDCIMNDFSSAQVGESLGFTAVNVRKRLSRALSKLRKQCRELWLAA